MFSEIKAAAWWSIALFLVSVIVLSIFINQGIFAAGLLNAVFVPIIDATRAFLNITFLANLLNLVLIVGGLFFLIFRLKPSDVGLRWEQIPVAVVVTLAVWGVTQLIVLVAELVTTGRLTPHPVWSGMGTLGALGLLVGQMFGNALFEEIAYRGFLMAQFYLKLERFGERQRLAMAVLGALLIFTLLHIFNRLAVGVNNESLLMDLLIIFWWGLFLSAIYLYTQNLWIAVGIHALINTPTLLFNVSFMPQVAVAAAALLVLAGWKWRVSTPQRLTEVASG
jgi:hypothetical protein